MTRILIACTAIACGATLTLATTPEVDKAIKAIQGVAADAARMKLFCALEQATESADGKSTPALEKQVGHRTETACQLPIRRMRFRSADHK